MLTGGVLILLRTRLLSAPTWGVAQTDNGDNIVWGTDDIGDNIVWGTDTGDNIVWGTDCGGADCDNIVWGTADAETSSGARLMPRQHRVGHGRSRCRQHRVGHRRPRQHMGQQRCLDNIIWGSNSLDNIVWGTAAATTTSCGAPPTAQHRLGTAGLDVDNIVWGTDGERVWGTDDGRTNDHLGPPTAR